VAPEAVAGFCWRGGTAPEAELEAEPGRGEVGGLLAVLLASLEGNKLNQYMNKTVTIKQINYND
jgi:hypothetical protein